MTLKSLLGACALATTLAAPAAAAPVNVDFSFAGVSGTLFGLDDAIEGSQTAATASIFGIFDNYLNLDFTRASGGFFFSGGALLTPDFNFSAGASEIIEGEAGTGNLSSLNCSQRAGCSITESDINEGGPPSTTELVPAVFAVTPAVVPLPAGVVLMLTGLAGLAGLRFSGRKKRTA